MAWMVMNRRPYVVLAATLLALPSVGRASVVFENTGTTAGWSTLWHEDQGSVTQVTGPAFKGGQALRCRTVYRAAYRGRYHSEARRSGMAALGQDRYYGFTFYLPSNWQFQPQSYNVQQFIGNVSGCSGGQPWTMTHLVDHTLITRITTGPDGCTRTHEPLTVTNDVAPGVWHRLVIHGRWAANSTGVFQVWYEGIQRIDQTNRPTAPNTPGGFNLAVGNYSNGWHDDKTMVGTQGTRDIFIDHVRVTTTYDEANPRSW